MSVYTLVYYRCNFYYLLDINKTLHQSHLPGGHADGHAVPGNESWMEMGDVWQFRMIFDRSSHGVFYDFFHDSPWFFNDVPCCFNVFSIFFPRFARFASDLPWSMIPH